MFKLISLATIFFLLFFSLPAYAYLGPGIGIGAFMAAFGVIIAVFAALLGLIWFPVKKLLQKRKNKKEYKKID